MLQAEPTQGREIYSRAIRHEVAILAVPGPEAIAAAEAAAEISFSRAAGCRPF